MHRTHIICIATDRQLEYHEKQSNVVNSKFEDLITAVDCFTSIRHEQQQNRKSGNPDPRAGLQNVLVTLATQLQVPQVNMTICSICLLWREKAGAELKEFQLNLLLKGVL